MKVEPTSFLFVTLDSCRYDVFAATETPNLRRVGPLQRAWAPGYFTYASHCAMFMGFTPGDATRREPFVNPKWGKIFRMRGGGGAGSAAPPFCTLDGDNVIDGLRRVGYLAVGTGAVDWFDDSKPTVKPLVRDFDRYLYAGDTFSLGRQLEFLEREIRGAGPDRPVFAFLNLGETHIPYWHEGAAWSRDVNPCRSFSEDNDAAECRRRQTECLRWVDGRLAPLLDAFRDANVIVCADHGDAWGEDGVWAHGVHHEKVLEVPLLLSLKNPPRETPAKGGGVLGRILGRR